MISTVRLELFLKLRKLLGCRLGAERDLERAPKAAAAFLDALQQRKRITELVDGGNG